MSGRRKRNADGRTETLELAAFNVSDELYLKWLAYVFARSPSTPWYFDIDEPEFVATSQQLIALMGRTMTCAGADLAPFDNIQIYHGLSYMFNSSCSNCAHSFGEKEVALGERLAAVGAMKFLYRDCFAKRCDSILGHLNEGKGRSLNMGVYMLWDETPIFYINRSDADITAAIVDVLEFALSLTNDACIESALHGLGHAEHYCPQLIHPVVDRFLETTRDADGTSSASGLRPIRNELRAYAYWARRGRVQ